MGTNKKTLVWQSLPPAVVVGLQRRILEWYRLHGRHDLPWRKRQTPYRVLISEVMLQQTQVGRVIPKFKKFTHQYPSFAALAKAETRKLLLLWSGLGYNRRALLLRAAARITTTQYHGRLPKDFKQLRQLPGIGAYTAHAINVFARNVEEPCIDTNVRRVLLHELRLPSTLTDRELENVARQLIPAGRSREWLAALMDYGALCATSQMTGISPRLKQTSFRGSHRELRGKLVRLALERKQFSTSAAAGALQCEQQRVLQALQQLQAEGILHRNKRQYMITPRS